MLQIRGELFTRVPVTKVPVRKVYRYHDLSWMLVYPPELDFRSGIDEVSGD